MKFWECIDIPGLTGVAVEETATPVESTDEVEEIKEADEHTHEEIVAEINTFPGNSAIVADSIISPEYASIVGAALTPKIANPDSAIIIADSDVSPISTDYYGGDPEFVSDAIESVSDYEEPTEDESAEVVDVETTDTNSAGYVSPDEAESLINVNVKVTETDFSDAITEYHGLVVPDVELPADDTTIEVTRTEDTIAVTETKTPVLDKQSILEGIRQSQDAAAEERAKAKIEENARKEGSGDNPKNRKLTEEEFADILDTLEYYHEAFFSELPKPHFNQRFLENIPYPIYKAHQTAKDVHEAPPPMDPLFWLYICTIYEDTYDVIGKFADIVVSRITDIDEWCDAVADSAAAYDALTADSEEETEEEESNE